jgi:hypothetical protein
LTLALGACMGAALPLPRASSRRTKGAPTGAPSRS